MDDLLVGGMQLRTRRGHVRDPPPQQSAPQQSHTQALANKNATKSWPLLKRGPLLETDPCGSRHLGARSNQDQTRVLPQEAKDTMHAVRKNATGPVTLLQRQLPFDRFDHQRVERGLVLRRDQPPQDERGRSGSCLTHRSHLECCRWPSPATTARVTRVRPRASRRYRAPNGASPSCQIGTPEPRHVEINREETC